MADLTGKEKRKLEKLFDMSGGYVLNFSDRTFEGFIRDTVDLEVYGGKYAHYGTSKANHLRAFWDLETNLVVSQLIRELVEYVQEENLHDDLPLISECLQIAEQLRTRGPIQELGQLDGETGERAFDLLGAEARAAVERGDPEAALDRLHTYLMAYIRRLCDKHGLAYTPSESLNAVFGKYVKHLDKERLIETDMARTVLKVHITVLSDFNKVRNDHSLAHPNAVPSYEESILIVGGILGLLRFIRHLEVSQVSRKIEDLPPPFDNWLSEEEDLPF